MLRAEELQDAAHRMRCAKERRIDVKPAEVFQWRPRKLVPDLSIPGSHREARGEVRHHAATMMRDHELARMPLHMPGIDEA